MPSPPVEYQKAIHIHVRQEQERHFALDIQLTWSGKLAAVTPSLLQLAPFLMITAYLCGALCSIVTFNTIRSTN